jgi:uncharacterized protein (DUF885 family)
MIRSIPCRTLILSLTFLSAFQLAACQSEAPTPDVQTAAPAQRSIEVIADEFLAAMLERHPSLATNYSIEGARHDRLFDNSLDALDDWRAREDAWLAELDAIGEPTDVGSRDWVTFGILHEQLAGSKAIRICRKELWETSTTTAWYNGMLGLSQGYSSPRLTVEAVPEEVRALLDDNSPFLAIGLRAEDEVFEGAVKRIFDEEIVPAINRYAEFIETEYLANARQDIAISFNPNGAECYPQLVRSFATIQPTADEIHTLGLKQMAQLRGEMEVTLAAHYDGEAIESFVRRINTDPEFTFRSEDEVLQYSLDSLDNARAKMADVFGLLPKADVLIKPYPAFAASGVGEYHSSSEDARFIPLRVTYGIRVMAKAGRFTPSA